MNNLLVAGLFVAGFMVVSDAARSDLERKIKNVKENSELTEEQKQAVIARLTEGSAGAAATRVGSTAAPSEQATAARRPAALKRTTAQEKTEDADE